MHVHLELRIDDDGDLRPWETDSGSHDQQVALWCLT